MHHQTRKVHNPIRTASAADAMIHPNDYFDKIYCLNLERRQERWTKLALRLARWGIRAQRFVAVEGRVPEIERQYRAALERNIGFDSWERGPAISSPGAFGCLLSHTAILEHAREHQCRRILVLEDDILLHHEFLDRFQEVRQLPSDWKLLYLGASQFNWNTMRRHGESFYHANMSLGTFAVAVDHAVYDPLLRMLYRKQYTVDRYFSILQSQRPGECFVFSPNLAIADVTESDIRQNQDQTQHAVQMRWDLGMYDRL